MKHAYLTIDDSPTKDFAGKADYLRRLGIPALFFSIGNLMEQRPEPIIAAIRQGFVIGNHSWTHPHFSDLSFEEGRDEILRSDRLIEELYRAAGVVRPGRYFRFPYFDTGAHGSGADYEAGRDASGEKKAALQSCLVELGYGQPAFQGLNEEYHRGLLDDADVKCTFNQMEYFLGNKDAPWGLSKPEAILHRIDEDAPFEGRSLNQPGSEIVLVHDHENTTGLFFQIIDRYVEKGLRFQPL